MASCNIGPHCDRNHVRCIEDLENVKLCSITNCQIIELLNFIQRNKIPWKTVTYHINNAVHKNSAGEVEIQCEKQLRHSFISVKTEYERLKKHVSVRTKGYSTSSSRPNSGGIKEI